MSYLNSTDIIKTNLAPEKIIQAWVKYALKGVHEYNSAAYIAKDKRDEDIFRCFLCEEIIFYEDEINEDDMKTKTFVAHVQSTCHEIRYMQLFQAKKVYCCRWRRRLRRQILD
jgi:hypothetical protein